MAGRNPHQGQLQEIIKLMNERPEDCRHPREFVQPLMAKGLISATAATPERTLCSVFSENPDKFHSTSEGMYYLDDAYKLKPSNG